MEIEFGQAGQLLAFDVLVQIELQRAFERTARLHECAVALVTHRDVVEAMTFHLQIRVDVFKLDPHRRCQAVALALRALQVHSGSASAGARRRSKAGRCQRRINPGPELVAIQFPQLVLVPFREPFFGHCVKFLARQFTVLILVARLEKSGGDKHRRAKPARTARAPRATARSDEESTAARGFHGFPLVRVELEMHRPDVGDLEKRSGCEIFFSSGTDSPRGNEATEQQEPREAAAAQSRQ